MFVVAAYETPTETGYGGYQHAVYKLNRLHWCVGR